MEFDSIEAVRHEIDRLDAQRVAFFEYEQQQHRDLQA